MQQYDGADGALRLFVPLLLGNKFWAKESQVISLPYIMWWDNLAFCYEFFMT